ncbi:MAG TPA: sensor domain-containing phosphodiesterase [Micromonosporaceae bacterium]|nr:sensor domain-containing phosphodiesterase [Micromonosporaceae bacterium]
MLAVLLTIAAQVGQPLPPQDWLLAIVYLLLFLAAEAISLRFGIRRHGVQISLSEVPLLLALFYLSPLVVVLVRVSASTISFARRSQSPVKLWFNVANAAAATAFSTVVVRALGPIGDRVGPYAWLVLLVAVTAGVLVTLLAVIGVITLVQGRISGPVLVRTAVPGLGVAAINIVLGLVVLVIVQQSPWGILLLVALVAFLVVIYRSYDQFLSQHRMLTEMFELTRALRGSMQDGALPDVLLSRVREMLQAEFATLWLPAQGRHIEVLLTARADDPGLLDLVATPDSLRRKALERDQTVAVSARLGDPEIREELDGTGTKDAIIVPLHSGTAVIGTLEVAGRLGDPTQQFGPADVRVLEAVAAHVAVAVENSRLVDRLRYDAYHDGLTGLPNRRRLTAALEESVRVRAPGEVIAVLLFDVNDLRQVNQSMGYTAGDKVLAEVGRRLRQHAPNAALVGRLGGDEFVVTLRTESTDAALDLAGELREQICDEMVFDSLALDIDTAVGLVVHPDHGSDPDILLHRADLAAEAAKSTSGGIQLFHLGLESRSTRRLGLAASLRHALDQNELEVYFQPKVTLNDRRLVGVECLARWEHPAHGSVAPEDFVAVAEHTGQLGRLTEAVIREGLRRSRDWGDTAQPLAVSVNLSARTLTDPHFPAQVQELLDEYGVAPELLTFEIREAGVLDGQHRPLPTLRRLREAGIRLAVDDFGTGYSSLAYLRRVPVHEVKIDRSLVQGMATDPGDLAIVNAVVTLSQQFGLNVVAEGVESELTLELLQDIGCEIGQGFLFSRPLPYERLVAWLEARTEPDTPPTGEVRRLRAVP